MDQNGFCDGVKEVVDECCSRRGAVGGNVDWAKLLAMFKTILPIILSLFAKTPPPAP